MSEKETIIVDGVTYQLLGLLERKGRSACALCEIKSRCYDLFHSDTPCIGGFYKKAVG